MLTLAVLAGLVFTPAASAAPNVVVFVTDDQRLDGTMQVMPQTTKWFHTGGDLGGGAGTVAGGTNFPNAVANTPWCCPARSSIFTGDFAHNHHVEQLDGTALGTTESAPTQQKTMQAYLKGASPSYRTGIFGKYLNNWGLNCPDPGGPPRPPFFDDYAIFENSSYSPTCVLEDEDPAQKWVWQYSTHYVRDKALEFLDQAEAAGQPWFLYVAPYAPHSPFLPESRYQDANVPALPETAALFESDRTDKPDWVRTGELNDAATIRAQWKQHLRMLKSVDDTVDAVMRKVKDLGEDENTIAFFTSDNGYMWGDHGGQAKARPYLASVNVPLYMRWPGWAGHSPNETDDRLAALIDIAPTVLDAAGITPGDEKDGRSLIETSSPRNHILMEQNGEGLTLPSWLSILTKTYHYIQTYAEPGGVTDYSQIESREYYDLTQDPLELRNLLGDDDPLNDPPTAGLAAQIVADRACAGLTCPPEGGDAPLEVQITRGPADDDHNSGSTSPRFYFTSSEPGSAFECRLEGPFVTPSWVDCLGSQGYSGLVNGDYTFSVRARMPGPVYSDVVTYAWHIDASVPETTITFPRSRRSTSQTAWFGFASSYRPDYFECRLNGGMWQTCTSPYSVVVPDAPESAPHELEVRAVSPYSLAVADPTPASYEWSVDSTPMEIDPATFNATAPSHLGEARFEFSAKEKPESAQPPGKEQPTGFDCRLDGGAWDPCTSPKQYTGLAAGHHSFSVRVTDQAGNVSATRDHEWDIAAVQTYHTLPDTSWPDVTAGAEVRAVIADGCGGWYAGGTFSEVGAAAAGNVVHITAGKAVDTTWAPAVTRTTGGSPSVRALLLVGGTLYIGGQFTHVDGIPRRNLAALSVPACGAAAAAAVTAWDPSPSNVVYGLAPGRTGMNTLYAVGAFNNFGQGPGSTMRRKVAEVQTTGTGAVTDWNPDANSNATLLAVTTGTTGVYVGGSNLTSIGGEARSYLAELDPVSGQATSWNPAPDGAVHSIYWRRTSVADSVAAAAQLPTLLIGGSFSHIGQPLPGTGQPMRNKAAELGASDGGFATPWDPSLNSTAPTIGAAYDILPVTTSSTIVAGGFSTVGPVARGRLAETDRGTGAVLDWTPTPDAGVFGLSHRPSGNKLVAPPVLAAGGSFSNLGSPAQQRRMLAFYCRMDLPETC